MKRMRVKKICIRNSRQFKEDKSSKQHMHRCQVIGEIEVSPDRQGVCSDRAEVGTVPWAGLTLQFASVGRPDMLGEVRAVIVQQFELCLVRIATHKSMPNSWRDGGVTR